jgi:negative regulator of flagellin synthesis FlgM
MSDIALVGGVNSGRVEVPDVAADRAAKARIEPDPTVRPSDRVDISDRARLLSRLAALPETRAQLVDSIRKQIADGTYETANRMDQAVTNLLGDLDLPH